MAFFTYLLRCNDGSYYAGHTDNLEHRLAQHAIGDGASYVAMRRPAELVWSQAFPTRDEALSSELRVKGWSRAKKEALIAGDWALIQSLARNRQGYFASQKPDSVRPEPVEGSAPSPPDS